MAGRLEIQTGRRCDQQESREQKQSTHDPGDLAVDLLDVPVALVQRTRPVRFVRRFSFPGGGHRAVRRLRAGCSRQLAPQQLQAEQQQAAEEAPAKGRGTGEPAYLLPGPHAKQRRREGVQGGGEVVDPQGADARQPESEGDGRDGEREAEGLDEFFPFQAECLDVWHGRHHEDAGAAGEQAGQDADGGRQRPFQAGRDGELPGQQAGQRVERQHGAQSRDGPASGVAAQHPCAAQRAGDDAEQHRVQAAQEVAQAGAAQQLPDVGHERGQDEQRGRGDGRHHGTEQAHRHRRQAHPGRSLDDARDEEGERDCEDGQGGGVGHRCHFLWTDAHYANA